MTTLPDFDRQSLRGSDTNSLLRMYDHAKDLVNAASSQNERVKAARAVRYIAAELERRKVKA